MRFYDAVVNVVSSFTDNRKYTHALVALSILVAVPVVGGLVEAFALASRLLTAFGR